MNQKHFVNADNTRRPDRPDGRYGGKIKTYRKVIEKIEKDGVCPFCRKNLLKYHKNPILKEGVHWLLTKNMYPYEGAEHHILIIHKKHIEKFGEVAPGAWEELQSLVKSFLKKENISGGTFMMRFGDTAHTGASVCHLHAHLVVPDVKNKKRKPIIARIG